MTPPLLRYRTLAVATIVFLATTAVAAGLAFAGSDLLTDRRVSVPLLLVALITGATAFLGWSAARTRGDETAAEAAAEREKLGIAYARREEELREEQARLAGDLDAARTELEAERQAREALDHDLHARLEAQERTLRETRLELESKLDERDRELAQERRTRARTEQSRREEKEWALHLRNEVMRLQRERGAIGDTRDVRQLVLRVAVTLVGARKGLLLSREDLDADEKLDLICHEGFQSDPGESAVAQRFAHEVLEKDVTIRENEHDIAPERRTPADEEIHNLLAIPIYIADRFSGVVVLANKEGGFDDYDDDVLLALGDHAGAVLHNAGRQDELRSSYVGTLRALANAIDGRERVLRAYEIDVARYVSAVADELGVEPKDREQLVYSSLLRDVGKIGISERILLKPAELTPEERSVVQLHPHMGYRLVQQVPALQGTEAAIVHHHERYDGNGYPGGLRGDQIPLEARIVAVADAFSAMTTNRPYRRRLSLEQACEELERCAGTQFDPAVARLFVAEVRRDPPRPAAGDALPARPLRPATAPATSASPGSVAR
jgi:HD-GYP domain-containing protein (c-di-GMP phosphodiesterase class II)